MTDSRHWQELNDKANLPGCIDDNFVQSILTTVEQRWTRPNSGSVPMLDKVLTPVIEMKDDNQDNSSEESGEVRILPASASNTIERPHERRRAHSLTKSSSTGYGEELDSVGGESDVFHSRTGSNASSNGDPNSTPPTSRLGPNFVSEDNLLQQTNRKVSNGRNTGSNGIAKVKVQEDKELFSEFNPQDQQILSDSNDSLKYDPFESPDVQALIAVSKSTHPHTFPRPANLSLPTRQMSEGDIKPHRPVFSIGSPPLDSPISLRSIDKSISMASSQGSFSEGFSEEVLSADVSSLRRFIPLGNGVEGGEGTSQSEEPGEMPHIRKRRGREKAAADSGIGDPTSMNGEEIPLPDDSPTTGSSKLHSLKHKHSLSRDSGLSDSPDPLVDLSSSPSHGINSRVLTDKLTQEMKKTQLSPLINRNRVSKPSDLSDNVKKFQELVLKENVSKPRPQRLTRHVMKVMKITPSFDSENSTSSPPPLLSPDSGDGDQSMQVQRLRMASPDELIIPSDRQLGFPMKRSVSQGEVLKSATEDIDDALEEETRVGGLIISEANARRRNSRAKKVISRSMENFLDNI